MTVITRCGPECRRSSIFLKNQSIKSRIQASVKVIPRSSGVLLARGDAFGTGKCADMRSFFNQLKDQKHVRATVGRRLQR